MDLFALILGKKKTEAPKTIADYQREALVRAGAKQFKELVNKGLRVPVALL